MSRRSSATSSAAAVVVGVILFAAWRLWHTGDRRRRRSGNRNTSAVRFLLTASVQNSGKVLDLRPETSFEKVHIRGSHNIPVASLWHDNRWYELPEQHEPLVVLIPEEGAPQNGMDSDCLAEEIKGRRAAGATATLVFDEALRDTAREGGFLFEEGVMVAAKSSLAEYAKNDWWPSLPHSTTLFTPSPFLTRAAAVIEPQLKHAWLRLTCIDIGCGAGRDAVWLAKRGWTVTAMDCWNQALQKAEQLARRNGVADRVEVVRGKVKHTGEIYLSEGIRNPAVDAVNERERRGDTDGVVEFSKPRQPAAASAAAAAVRGEDCIIGPATPPSEYDTFALVVAIRFLERSAFDTLARLVDPRGGYILLSTFIEEERETPRKTVGDGGGDESTGGGVGSSGVGREKEGGSPRFAAVRVGGTSRKNNKHGSTAATLEAAIAAATLARWPHASPRDYKKILRRGELARYFGDRHGFEVLEDSVARLPDGRPVACFLARRMPLVVSSPSNASNASSVNSPWRDDNRRLCRQDPQQQGGGMLLPRSPATLASTFGTTNEDPGSPSPARLLLGKSPLSPTPEFAPPSFDDDDDDDDNDDDNDDENNEGNNTSNNNHHHSRRRTVTNNNIDVPANSFPIHSLALSDDDDDQHGGDGDDNSGAVGGVNGGVASNGSGVRDLDGGRAAMWVGVSSGAGSGSRRDFTATRAASSRRRLAEAAAATAVAERLDLH